MKNALRRLKSRLMSLVGKGFYERPDIKVNMMRLGSGYGGWCIVPDSVNSKAVVYSFGVGEDASFDIALIDRFKLTVHAFDPTPRSIAWVKSQAFSPAFVLHEYGVAGFDGTVHFNPPDNPAHVSHTLLDKPRENAITVPVKRLKTILDELGHSQIDLLKMDIEGAEYDVIDDMVRTNIRPRQLLVEFHHRFKSVGSAKTKDAMQKIRSMGYKLFAVSPTNEEFSFLYSP